MKRPRLTLSPWLKRTLMLTVAGLTALIAFSHLQFGSMTAAMDFLAGERLLVDSKSKSFGRVDEGSNQTLEFSLTNRTGKEIHVLGSRSSCGCTVATNLPFVIRPEETKPIVVLIRTEKSPGNLSATVRVFSDDPGRPEIVLNVRGTVRPRLSNPIAMETTGG